MIRSNVVGSNGSANMSPRWRSTRPSLISRRSFFRASDSIVSDRSIPLRRAAWGMAARAIPSPHPMSRTRCHDCTSSASIRCADRTAVRRVHRCADQPPTESRWMKIVGGRSRGPPGRLAWPRSPKLGKQIPHFGAPARVPNRPFGSGGPPAALAAGIGGHGPYRLPMRGSRHRRNYFYQDREDPARALSRNRNAPWRCFRKADRPARNLREMLRLIAAPPSATRGLRARPCSIYHALDLRARVA